MTSSSSKSASLGAVEFVLVYGPMRTGGIETLIIRMADFLSRRGHRVSLLCGEGELISGIPASVRLMLHDDFAQLERLLRNGAFATDGPRVIIVSFDPISAAKGLLVTQHIPRSRNFSHISGIFHPRAYFMAGERRDRVWLNRQVAETIGFDRLFFMNKECRDSHAQAWGVNLADSSLVALPIEMTSEAWRAIEREPMKIVSVGRLVDFKAYNLGAARIAAKCAASGSSVAWDIFGTGPLASSIQGEISALGVTGSVRLRGLLEYRELAGVVSKYDLFIGLGTAALEAAMLGVPTICAVDGESEFCYGFLHEIPYGNVGEMQDAAPTLSIADLIRDFAQSGISSRMEISRLGRRAAMRYEMSDFIDRILIIGRSDRRSAASRLRTLVTAMAYEFATEGALVRFLRATLGRVIKVRTA